jgi:hypothetical protein
MSDLIIRLAIGFVVAGLAGEIINLEREDD